MTIYDTVDANAIQTLRKIYDRYNIPHIIGARNLDFAWRKDGREGHEQADAIKDLLRYLPRLIAIAEAHPDPDYVSPSHVGSEALSAGAAEMRREGWGGQGA